MTSQTKLVGSNRGRGYLWIAFSACVILVALNLIGSIQVIRTNPSMEVSYPVVLRVASGVGITALFAALAIALLRVPNHALGLFAPLISLYGLWDTLWLILFAQASYDQGRIGFQLIITLVCLIPIWALHFRWQTR